MNATRSSRQRDHRQRAGYVAPLVVGALLVVFGAAAVAVDQLWLSHAKVELQASADASCLAAARTLVTDETLRDEFEWEPIVERALENAQRASRLNAVAGGRLELRPGPEGDVWFGRYLLDGETGQRRFVFTDYAPTTVVVRAERTQDTDNPVRMLMGGLFGVHEADVSTMSEVTIDNHVVGVRPGRKLPVPAVPFAILDGASNVEADEETEAADSESNDEESAEDEAEAVERSDTWSAAIDARGGNDEYAWDPDSERVVKRSDGIPEIVVRPMPKKGRPEDANVQLLDLGSDFRYGVVRRQCEQGLLPGDLDGFGGELLLDGRTIESRCSGNVNATFARMIEELVGQTRICFLYDDHESYGRVGEGRLRLTRLVAVRVLDVRRENGEIAVVLQPAVVATRTALLEQDWEWADDEAGLRNPYVFQLTVTQ